MPSIVLEWLHLLGRWVHVMAAILWIGDSFLFMWMDKNLREPERPREGAVAGELWMVHSGGFYELVKRRFLAPHELPRKLHWFKWESYTTWLSGLFLLVVVYYLSGGVYLTDGPTGPTTAVAVAIGVGALVLGWIVYDVLWSSPLRTRPNLAAAISFALLVAAAYGMTRVFSGRAAFLHTGALMGTIMTANVWRRIIPSQNQMLAATAAGQPVDTTLGARAKLRSTHNHYLTFPVLLTMLSNHFPGTYGSALNWVVLVLMIVLGASVKYVLNFGVKKNAWIALAGAASLIGLVTLTSRSTAPASAAASFAAAPPVSFASANAIIERRCQNCHAAHPANPSFPQPPSGIVLEDPRRIQALAPRILARAVTTRTMPLANLTGMTDAERDTLGAWIAQGARLDER